MCRGLRGLRVCRWLRAKFVGCAAAPKDDIEIPAQGGGLRVAHVAGSVKHFLLLRSDGTAVACGGDDKYGELSILALEGGVTYTQVGVSRYSATPCCSAAMAKQLLACLPSCLACLLAGLPYPHCLLAGHVPPAAFSSTSIDLRT